MEIFSIVRTIIVQFLVAAIAAVPTLGIQTFGEISMINERLKTARLRAKLSQEKLGKLAGIDPTSASARMNQYERGKHAPDYRLMTRVAEILNMPVSWFYTADDEQARLQELFYQMDAQTRRNLLAQAERMVSTVEKTPVTA